MAAIRSKNPDTHFEIFTQVPEWFFKESLDTGYTYHSLLTDIGLIQTNSLHEDLPQTVARLNSFLPFSPDLLASLAQQVEHCSLILCDIAPMAIAVANEAEVPSVLVENFTWDWIYDGYANFRNEMEPHINYLRQLNQNADHYIQTEPICHPVRADLVTPPVSRKIKRPATEIRRQLSVSDNAKMVVLTMGGGNWDYSFLNKLSVVENIHFVVAGGVEVESKPPNLITLPRESSIYHPDLINAANAVIGKVGYSTLAEVYQAGVPFGYLSRPNFRESSILAKYIEQTIPSLPFSEADLYNGEWLVKLPKLLALPRAKPGNGKGADMIAEFMVRISAGN